MVPAKLEVANNSDGFSKSHNGHQDQDQRAPPVMNTEPQEDETVSPKGTLQYVSEKSWSSTVGNP